MNDLDCFELKGHVKSVQTKSNIPIKYRVHPNEVRDTIQTIVTSLLFDPEGYLTYDSNNGVNNVRFNKDSSVITRISGYGIDTSKIIHTYNNCRLVKCQDSRNISYYEYDSNGDLKSKTLIGRLGDTIAIYRYSYVNNRIVRAELFYLGKTLEQKTFYKYDFKGMIIERRIVNNEDIVLLHEKHVYRKGLLKKSIYIANDTPSSITKYSYDERRNWIKATTHYKLHGLHGNDSEITRIISYY